MSNDLRNLLITIILSTMILVGWQYFYESPKTEHIKNNQIIKEAVLEKNNLKTEGKVIVETSKLASPKLAIISDKIKGEINLRGARFSNITLNDYFKDLDKQNGEVQIFNSDDKSRYFVEFNWLTQDKTIDLPNENSIWKSDKDQLSPNNPVTLHYRNAQNIDFYIKISLDEGYLFNVTQTIKNKSNNSINVSPYGLINRKLQALPESVFVIFEGAIAGLNKNLIEVNYNDLAKNKNKEYLNNNGGWLGITDKYWLSSIIIDKNHKFNSYFKYTEQDNSHIYQTDFVAENTTINPNTEKEFKSSLFVGPKKSSIINDYQKKLDINLFDRTIDYGWFYFLTKPMFYVLQVLFDWTGNFGLAIILMTFAVKLIMFPMANKSYRSMHKMRIVQPKLEQIKEKHSNDRMKLNQEIMELYKKEKINPLSGCLPIFIQIPVFFSLYKIIYVALEMRHAPFFGWIKDLSAPDPTSIFNLFGLIAWQPPSILQIGIWPLIMGVSFFLQQKFNPQPTDPVQAKVMKFLPLIFVVMFHNFPAGLMIYWSFSNSLSILQQWALTRTNSSSK